MTRTDKQHYQQIKQALEVITQQVEQQKKLLTLEALATQVGMSPFYFQRVFSEWAGLSPKSFQQHLLKTQAQTMLLQASVQEASNELGLSSSSRLHDLMISTVGMTPGEYKQQGKDLLIEYGWADSLFGMCFLAQTQRGICKLAFYDDEHEKQFLIDELKTQWSLASIQHEQAAVQKTVMDIFNAVDNQQKINLHIMFKGTPFQMHVWEALLKIPSGKILSYGQFASLAQKPKAVRAVSSAVANNPIAYLIPCHRVIRKTGAINQYRWGKTRKQAILLKECLLAGS